MRRRLPTSSPQASRLWQGGERTSAAPTVVAEALRSPGKPLDAVHRALTEERFGHSFSDVRLHTDEKAVESARAVDAAAYTVGRDIVFGAGRYTPGTSEGRRLLAHELTHVVQQTGRSSGPVDTLQRERLAVYALRPGPLSSTGHASVGLTGRSGKEQKWGFYAACTKCIGTRECSDWELFSTLWGVPGRICNDRASSYDESISYEITEEQYRRAQAMVEAMKGSPPEYDLLTYNCTDFTRTVAEAAGIGIPDFSGVDEPEELADYIYRELARRVLHSGKLHVRRLAGGSPINLNAPATFEVSGLPQKHSLRFRWVIADKQDNRYLMMGARGGVFQYGRQFSAFIPSRTAELLKSRGVTEARILCRATAGVPTESLLMELPVTFTW